MIGKNNKIYRFLCILVIACMIVTVSHDIYVSADEIDAVESYGEDTEITGNEYTYNGLVYYVDTAKKTAVVAGSAEPSVKTLDIPDTITYEGSSIKVVGIGAYAFEASSLTSVKIGANVLEIGDGAFAFSEEIKKITVPKKCTRIGNAAFFMCDSLSKVSFNKKAKLKSIGDGAFAGTAITAVTIPNATTSIGDASFGECRSLQSVTLGKKLKSIGEGAFAGCSALTTVKKASGNNSFVIEDNIIYSEGYAELVCGTAAAGSFKIKEGTQVTKARAFEGNEAVISVEIPDSVTLIGECAFINCLSLEKVTVLGGFKETEANIFYGCDNLKMIVCGGEG